MTLFRLRKPASYLLAGAIINLLVAWGSILTKADGDAVYFNLGEPDETTRWYGGIRKSFWKSFVWRSPTWICESTFFSTKPGAAAGSFNLPSPIWSRIRIPVSAAVRQLPHGFAELEEARGLPLRTMAGYTQMKIDLSQGGWVRSGQTWALKLGRDQWTGGPPSMLLMRPLFVGFAVNTVFYSAILYGVRRVPQSIIQRRRRRRGLCPACAYPIGTSPVCTECGKPVRGKA
jgi:hypothetical protein